MPSPDEPKPKGGGWAAKFGFGSRKATKKTPKIEKPKPDHKPRVERLRVDPANTYTGRFGQIQDAVVITKPPPLVIRVIPNRPRVGDIPINQFDAPRPAPAPPIGRSGPNSIALPEQSLAAYGFRGQIVSGQEPIDEEPMWRRRLAEHRSNMAVEDRTTMKIDFHSRPRPNPPSGRRTIPVEHCTIPAVEDRTSTPIDPRNRFKSNPQAELYTMPAEHCAILAAEGRAILAAEGRAILAAEGRTILAAEGRTSMPTELHINPQPIPSTESAPIHSPMPRGMRTDYLKTLWERDLLRNPQSAPSVISVSTIDTCIFDRPVSMAASLISSETDDDESTIGPHSAPSVLSIASVVTCIFNPLDAAAVSSTPFASDALVSDINHKASALMPLEDLVLVRKRGDEDDWLHGELDPVLVRKRGDEDDWLHGELYGYLDSIVVVKDRSSDACSDAGVNAGSDAGSVYTQNTPGRWIGDPGDWNSENYSLFQENTPSEPGEAEPQATDNNFDQQIGIATTSPSDRFSPKIASTELQNVLPAVDRGGDALGGWPLRDSNRFEFPIEDGRSVRPFSPLIAQSPACQNNSRPQASKLAFQALEEPLDLVANGQPTGSLLPETANQINSTVENGGSANPASLPPGAPRTRPRLVRWLRRLTESKDAQRQEARRARPRRWYLLRDRSNST